MLKKNMYNHRRSDYFCISSEILISMCPSRVMGYKSGATEELAVETATRNGNCQVFSLIFQWDIY
jgi:hypothetical protein